MIFRKIKYLTNHLAYLKEKHYHVIDFEEREF